MTTFKKHFDSVQEFCTVEMSSGRNETIFNNYVEGHTRYKDGEATWMFGSAKNYAGLRRRMEQGWEEGADRIRQIEAGEIGVAKSTKRKQVRADQGDSLDVHAVYSGNLDRAWTRTRRQYRRSPATIRIVAVVAGSCAQSADQFFYRGAACAKLCDLLTEAGYNVEIVAACVAESISNQRTEDYCATITLKHSTAPLDLSNLAAVLCQQGFVRYYMFRSFGAAPVVVGSHMGTYGDKQALNQLAREACEESNVKTIFMRYDVDSASAAQSWIDESIKAVQNEEEYV